MRNNDEDTLQSAVVEWMGWALPDVLFFAVPNGGHRPDFVTKSGNRISLEAIKLKRMGVKAGVADLLLFPLDGAKIAIELKVHSRKQSENQKKFEEAWIKTGGKYYLCYSLENVENAVRDCGLVPKYQIPVAKKEVRRQMKQYSWMEAQRP